MSDLVGNPEDRFSGVAAHICKYRFYDLANIIHATGTFQPRLF